MDVVDRIAFINVLVDHLSNGKWPDEMVGINGHAAQAGWWMCVERLEEYRDKLRKGLNDENNIQ